MKKSRFCAFLLKLIGWTADDQVPVPEDKCVILGVPHTCISDFFVAYLFYRSIGGRPHIMIKKEFFVWPVAGLMKKIGCIPVDRSNGATIVRSVIAHIENIDGPFHLCIAPEGTRKPVHRWKAGYHTIAKALGCPVYLGYFNWATKHIGMGKKFELTDDSRADTARIQDEYEKMNLGAKYPEKYLTR